MTGCGVGGLKAVLLGLAMGLGLAKGLGLPPIDDKIFFDAAFGLQAVVEGPCP
jgi:hypothetical protein